MNFEDVIRVRESVRKFTDEVVSDEKLNMILEAGRIAPTAKNFQPQKIYVARSEEVLAKIDSVTRCRYNANTVLIICADKEKSFSMDDYSSYEMDGSIITTHMMLEATNIGVDSVWVRWFDAKELKRLLGLSDSMEIVALLPIGYRTDDYQGSPNHGNRKPLNETVEYI